MKAETNSLVRGYDAVETFVADFRFDATSATGLTDDSGADATASASVQNDASQAVRRGNAHMTLAFPYGRAVWR